jgi:dTDP-N-acetylfucosamine:lipid II N-acetylfucosaminyltransferase
MTAIRSETVDADVLHIVEHQKFIPPFIALVNNNLDSRRHHFFFIRNGHKYQMQGLEKVTLNENASLLCKSWAFIKAANRAKKIVLHGLFSSWLIVMLFFQPWLLAKCYWIIWGGDLYNDGSGLKGWRWQLKEWFRRPVIRRVGHLVTYVKGDVDLAREIYGARGQYCECLAYPSNTFQFINLEAHEHIGLNILVGNSADPSNEHLEVLTKLQKIPNVDIKAYLPLSYGDEGYAQHVIDKGCELLAGRMMPLREFMPYSAYLQLLATIDIAIFNHRRQQGMGNIIALLGMGKTVYMRSDTTSWKTLAGFGLVVEDVLNLKLDLLPHKIAELNRDIVRKRFSEKVLVDQLYNIMEC